jgi:hypothetical protein
MDNKTRWMLLKDQINKWIANHLPHQIVYFAVVRATNYATSSAWEPRNDWRTVTASTVMGCWHAKKAWKDKREKDGRKI